MWVYCWQEKFSKKILSLKIEYNHLNEIEEKGGLQQELLFSQHYTAQLSVILSSYFFHIRYYPNENKRRFSCLLCVLVFLFLF